MRFGFLMVASVALLPLNGQTILAPEERPKADAIFEKVKGPKLKCNDRSMEPWVDFGFRFELRYWVGCELAQFGGGAGDLLAFVRVTTENGEETVLGNHFLIPAAPKQVDPSSYQHLKAEIGFSGAIAAGPGVYSIELLLVDNRNRVYRHHWKAKAVPPYWERDLKFTLPANTLAPLRSMPILAKTTDSSQRPITVFLNAAPLNPWSRKLHAWDRAFLLDSLAALLREIPYSSVRVVAFNLDQQHEIFRQNDFSESDMPKLRETLRRLELGTISYEALNRAQGWANLLLHLLNEEEAAEQRSKAVVFLGPMLRITDKIPAEMLLKYKTEATTPVFCVTYYPSVGADFPDSLQYLTSALKGKVFRIHTPGELAQNLEKLRRQMDQVETTETIRDRK